MPETNFSRMRTSLTKHGAHKIAVLLEKYPTKKVLESLVGVESGVNIDLPQAKANLSADKFNKLPPIWDKVKAAGKKSIEAMVLMAIIFSHNELIKAFRAGRTTQFRGTIERGTVVDAKAFTNTANNLEELGYTTAHSKEQVTYNFSKLFEIPDLNKLAVELLALKLAEAGWSGHNDLVEEVIAQNFHEVFSVTAEQFTNWLNTGDIDSIGDNIEDEDYFKDLKGDSGPADPFVFKPGHTPRKTGKVAVSAPTAGTMASLLHNELQTALYEALCATHGKEHVATELPTGHGTSIDVVVKTPDLCCFYEIKVAKTLKACIRQAIPQLLEYAYWRDDTMVADTLVIASKFPMTRGAESFLDLLRTRFALPIYYEQIFR